MEQFKNLRLAFDILMGQVNGGEKPENIRISAEVVIREIGLLEQLFGGEAMAQEPKQRKQAKPGRKKSDPESDAKIAAKIAGGKQVQKVAEELGVSRQSVFKAVQRHEKREAEKAAQNSGSGSLSGEGSQNGEYHPTNDQLRAAGVLLFGGRPGNNKADIIAKIKKDLDKV